MLRLTKTAASENHEEIFLAHYSRLRAWALTLTNRDNERAEDLVHDAFVQFTFSRPDISTISNLNGYLFTLLRNLYLSKHEKALSRLPPPNAFPIGGIYDSGGSLGAFAGGLKPEGHL